MKRYATFICGSGRCVVYGKEYGRHLRGKDDHCLRCGEQMAKKKK